MTSQPRILLLGDSITQQGSDPAIGGFQTLLEADYIRRADIINRGLSGYNTRWYLDFLPQILTELQGQRAPSLVTLFLGANDADLPTGTQHVPLDQYETNTKKIISTLRAAYPEAAFVLLTPPPVGDNEIYGRNNVTAGKYAASCVRAGATLGVPVVDLWTGMQPQRESYLSDGLHLNVAGNRFVYEAFTATIAKHFPTLAPAAIPFFYPEWTALVELDEQKKA
ncbi:isoamyl acetate-hydrolyzing esterase [Achlya hypogyna]|uniref:Isoamyl acetate-hydrolyzing esterase n=1 Tax=Achlya hypogyna TaxID=1202772 RepID=A0A1V9Y4T6_ACHHY|nr:isoamyl acetate-hydrolyzing esterase [Achlya hypogyna]